MRPFGRRSRGEAAGAAPSQRQLIWLRFRKHKLAVVAVSVLGCVYFVALFAGFFAPHGIDRKDLDYAYCPPQRLCFGFEHGGFYTPVLRQHVDPVTLRQTCVRAGGEVLKLGFFVEGDADHLLGLVPCRRHFFGPDPAANGWAAGERRRPFLFLGGDKYGRDLLSRLLQGARVSLSVGLAGIAVTFVLGLAVGGISGYMSGRADLLIQRLIEIINSFPRLPMWLALGAAVPGVILGETSLSFLALGLREPVVSWGVILQDCMDIEAVRYYPWLMAPVVMIVMTVLCFNFLGDGLRDAADPYATR